MDGCSQIEKIQLHIKFSIWRTWRSLEHRDVSRSKTLVIRPDVKVAWVALLLQNLLTVEAK